MLALFLSDAYIQRARTVDRNPRQELPAAADGGDLRPVVGHARTTCESSAYETMGERPGRSRSSSDALSLEPQNSATLGVLGDFEARGQVTSPPRALTTAGRSALNPLDTGLQQLARIRARAAARAQRRRRLSARTQRVARRAPRPKFGLGVARARPRPRRAPQIRVAVQPADRAGQRRRVAGRDHQAGADGLDQPAASPRAPSNTGRPAAIASSILVGSAPAKIGRSRSSTALASLSRYSAGIRVGRHHAEHLDVGHA